LKEPLEYSYVGRDYRRESFIDSMNGNNENQEIDSFWRHEGEALFP
jgi:hypothetical protein